jgi:hypothetical protein
MKEIASALFFALSVFATGCSAYRSYTYSSPEGKTCLSKCESARWECRTRCGAEAVCLDDCEEEAKNCRKNCPAVSVEEPDWTY